MSKSTLLPTPDPAHPWIKTARTVLAGVLTAAVLLPLAIQAASIDVTAEGWAWLGGVLAVLGAVTRIMAVPQINLAMQKLLGLGSKDVETGQVVALQVRDGQGQTVVAGDASVLPTGTPLEVSTTVGELGQTMRTDRDAGEAGIVMVVGIVAIVVLVLIVLR